MGVVVLVSLFCWLISRSSRSSKEDQIASEIGGDLKQDIRTGRIKSQSRMASLDGTGVAVELHSDMDLLSPPLPEEIERKREAMEQSTADTLDVDVRTVLNIPSPPPLIC